MKDAAVQEAPQLAHLTVAAVPDVEAPQLAHLTVAAVPDVAAAGTTLSTLDVTPIQTGLLTGTALQLGMKRAVDIIGSLLLLIVLAPVLVVAALLVWVTSPGPIFYTQERLGAGARPFRIFKFRSMYRDADQRLAEVAALNEVDGPVFKIRKDPRVTPVGRVLRRLSIDEMPQLFNVLSGEMSLVGPRPPLQSEYDQYTPRQRQRLLVKPGLTCTWQVSGRSHLNFDTWVEMDLAYIHGWTLWLDVKILLRTLPAVVSGRGAY